jgi:branched-subunit amino acid ABC-type transport system permease component
MDDIVIQILNILSAGSVLLILALGVAVIFGVLRVINFAHGELVMLGGYSAVFTHYLGLDPWFSLLIAPIIVGGIGLGIERTVIRPLARRPLDTILATIALSIVIREAVETLWGPNFRFVPGLIQGSVAIGDLQYPYVRFALIAIAAAVVVVLILIELRTRWGLTARAVIANPELASTLGINVELVYTATFVCGAALAGFAGALIVGASFSTVYPFMGLDLVVNSFLVVLVGGLGSVIGLVAGSAALGGVRSLTDHYSNTAYAQVAMLLAAALILRILPNGLARRE